MITSTRETTEINEMLNIINELKEFDLDNGDIGYFNNEICGDKNSVVNAIEECSLDDAKFLALKYSNKFIRSGIDLEDRLCDLMGEDEYFDWADENGVG